MFSTCIRMFQGFFLNLESWWLIVYTVKQHCFLKVGVEKFSEACQGYVRLSLKVIWEPSFGINFVKNNLYCSKVRISFTQLNGQIEEIFYEK